MEKAQMESKERNVLLIVILAASLFIVFDCLTGKAGSLEPDEPPKPTMVTLGEISTQIETLSSPVKKVVRGVIAFPKNVTTGTDDFSPLVVDPNRSVVLLSDSVAFNRESTPEYGEWLGRTGACLTNLTEEQITVEVEPHPANQKVSYQIIEYK